MKYLLPANNLYGNTPVSIDLPDSWDVQTYSYAGEKATALEKDEISCKINSAIGVKPISEDARGCKDAVIIIDDITRPTNASQIARIVISQLEEAKIPRNKIRFMFATGMHRAMYREDYVRKLDEELVSEFPIYCHNPFYNNVLVGHGIHNTPIELNTDCVRAGYKVAIGAIFQHTHTGIGGGGKIILPGIASSETIRRFHLYPAKSWDISSDMRTLGLQAAKFLPLNMKIDVLLNGKGEAAELYAGDCEAIIQEKFDEVKAFFKVEKPEPVDLLILNNYFKPTEPSVVYSDHNIFNFVKPGGDVVVMSNSPQGAAAHYLLGVWGASCIGGPMYYNRRNNIPSHIRHYFAYSEFLDRGVGESFHLNGEQFIWANRWGEVLDRIGTKKLSVAILPYATVSCME